MARSLDQKIERLLKAMEGISSRRDEIGLKFYKLENRINYLEHKVEQRYKEIKQTTDNKIFGLTVRIKELENYKADTEKAALMQESYKKRLNILIHGIEEDEDSVWESHQKTLETFAEFLKNALEMDPDDIEVADIHRLPQTPQSRKGVRVNRTIIVKLSHAMDKKQIFSNLKKLKSFNTMRRAANKSTIFGTEHLMKVFLQ